MYDNNHRLAIIAWMNQLLAHSNTFSNEIQKNVSFMKKLIDCYMFGNCGFYKFKIQLELFISFSKCN